MTVRFSVQGNPKAQPRTKATAFSVGGRVRARVYTPGTAAEWKQRVWLEAEKVRPARPLTGAVVKMQFTFQRPKRLLRKKDNEDAMPHTSKPDTDNLAKLVLDTLTEQGWWRDDGVVWSLHVAKMWNKKGSTRMGVQVLVSEGEWRVR